MSNSEIVTVNEDITQYGITSIYKDNDGFMWIGTFGDGLYRYNSIEFKNYNKEFSSKIESLNSSIVHTIYEEKNRIWVGTDQGLNYYNKNLDNFSQAFSDKNLKSEKFAVHSIIKYDDNTFLLGTHGNGLYKFDINKFTYKPITYNGKGEGGLLINTIIKSPSGKYLIGTNYGLMTYDPYKEELELAKIDTGNGYDFINKSIQSMILAKDNSIWIGTFSSGLFKLTEIEPKVYLINQYKITKKRILSLTEKTNGNILCGSENDGLFEYINESKEIKNYKYNRFNPDGLKSNSIWTVYSDEKDRLWLGYYNKGIDLYDNNYSKFNSLKNSPSRSNSLNSNSVTGLSIDKFNRLWIGLLDGGVDVYDSSKDRFFNLFDSKNPIAKGLKSQDVQTIFIDSKNNVWVGTWNDGLYLLKDNKKRFINFNKNTSKSVFKSNRVMSFSEDSKGLIWIGTFLSGIYSYNPTDSKFKHYDSKEFSKYNINTSDVRKVLVDKNDNIWIGSRLGLFKIEIINKSSYNVISFNDDMNRAFENLGEPSPVFSLFEDIMGHIWIGTKGRGLFKYNADTDSFKWFNNTNGLIHQTVSSIIQDDRGHLWIGGNKGLSKLNIVENKFTNYNKNDGLLSNNFNFNSVYKTPGNEIYFGNSKGINFFNPNDIITNKEKPIVYLTDLKVSNELIKPSKESPLKKVISETKYINLKHDQSSFSIEFAGINYTRSENNQYAYLLEGYDDNWNYVQNLRVASFKGVPPGKYVFKVKASNNDGLWNDAPVRLEINILPGWWATTNAFLFYLVLILLLLYLIPKFVSDRIKEKRVLREERQDRKQFEILNSKKIQFFTNISHEFRTPLTLILSPLEEIISQNSNRFSSEVKEKHNIIYKNAKRLSRLINELMDFRKLQFNKMNVNASQIKIVPFIKEVASHFEEEAVLKNIVLAVEYQEDNLVIWSDPSMLEKIIFNLLSNAFKASDEEGSIVIEINKSSEFVLFPLISKEESMPAIEIVIKDTGVGIKKENIDKVFNRFYQVNEMNNQYYGGTGIGLELVKSFIDLHKGKIELTSKENQGTQFKIFFPMGYSHLKIEELKESDMVNRQYSIIKNDEIEEIINENSVKNKKTILVVEDNFELRSYVKNQLEKEYNIKEAENGKQGFELAIKYIPDLIITDVMMPIMDGLELCKLIKNDIKTSHIPLLMITAKGMQIDKVKGIDSGADVYLNKPFNMKVLKSHLNQLITSRQILFDKYFTDINDNIDSKNTTSLDKQFITNILSYINDNINDEKLNVEHLAGELFLSRSKLYRKIKALTGETANEFIRKVRLKKAKQIIQNSNYTISEVCYKVGFSSPSYFTKCFKDHFGVLPTEIREKIEVN